MKAVSIIEDRTGLVAALRLRGVDYLSPSDATSNESVDDETLIASLAAHSDPRLRQALIALFLLQPHLAPLVPALRDRMEAGSRQALLAGYMAAVYLQRMWSVRLGHYLPGFPDLPDYFSRELALPEPDEGHGEFGLHALADWQNSHSPDRFNHLSEYEGVADLLFQRLKLKRDRREPTQER
jgi:hypothetical protein